MARLISQSPSETYVWRAVSEYLVEGWEQQSDGSRDVVRHLTPQGRCMPRKPAVSRPQRRQPIGSMETAYLDDEPPAFQPNYGDTPRAGNQSRRPETVLSQRARRYQRLSSTAAHKSAWSVIWRVVSWQCQAGTMVTVHEPGSSVGDLSLSCDATWAARGRHSCASSNSQEECKNAVKIVAWKQDSEACEVEDR